MTLIEYAEKDYQEGRFYSTVQTLLSVMDGFVNDVEPEARRGLHARNADDMTAWDSVVGHHLGLKHAHATFTKTFHKVSTIEVHQLYRNGIVHGMLVNYDNEVVASKAWNRLFAVTDWAESRKRAKAPPKERPSLRATLREHSAHRRKHRLIMESLDGWEPTAATSGDAAFQDDPVISVSREFLDAWRARNFGGMARLLSPLMAEDTVSKTAGDLRQDYSDRRLDSYDLFTVAHTAPAVATVRARLLVADNSSSEAELDALRSRRPIRCADRTRLLAPDALVPRMDQDPELGRRLVRRRAMSDGFVIMQIGNAQLDVVYRDVLVPAITTAGLEPKRVDKHNAGGLLKNEIVAFIERAHIIDADLTNERPNCYLRSGTRWV